ncbi:MAG: phosphatidate cytidylyltransferase, partial [Sphingobium sp.]|nr:phosphatidate cytidylyltransferase [Sphingobium sp.]
MKGKWTVADAAVARTSDLSVRILSALVMLAVAAAALWAGGVVLDAFIALVALAAFVELVRLVMLATASWPLRAVGILAGAAYFGAAAAILMGAGTFLLVMVLGITVFTDTGAF